MNIELLEKMTELLESRRSRRIELAEEYKTAKGEDAKRIYNEVAEIVKGNNEINAAIKSYKKAEEIFSNTAIEEEQLEASNNFLLAEEKLMEIANKYGIEMKPELPEEIEEEVEEENISEEIVENRTESKKNNTLKYIAVGAMGLGIGAGVTACAMSQEPIVASYEEETQNTEDQDEQLETQIEEEFKEKISVEKEEIKIEDVDTKLYGMTSAFTNASDETQVIQRATDIYNLYVNTSNMPEAMKEQLSIERIANFIRMANGEFALEDGQIDYNGSIFDEMGNLINSYHNSTSFVEYGTDLEFKPTCVFFENDSLAHHSAAQADVLVKEIYEDIRNNDIDKFQKDAVAWGEFVRDTVIYNDFTGKTISLWSMENEQKYPLLKTLTSVYAPSIMEYSIGIDLARRDNSTGQFGDTFGICIPFCYNAQNEIEYMPLSEMIYHINETPINHLAKRAGFAEEWAQNNESLMVMAGLSSKSYFDSKYELEVGNKLKLK